jgi:glycosyltransferase involved in cell wall biosynthesis
VGSKGLEDQYDKFGKKTFFLNAVFKENAFKVWTDASKFFNKQLVIGWTGNPKRGFKGFEDIILPAIKLVKDSGRDIVLKTQFSGTYDSLIDFYTDVALVVIASEADTGPFMFSEASLSGIPAISTKVGFPRMVIQDGKNGIIVKERTVRYFVESICKLFDDRELLFSMAERIRGDYLKILGNDVLVDNWKNAIEFMIHNPRPK